MLSIDFLAQLPAGTTGSARLVLTGCADGNRPVRHSVTFEGVDGSWQTVHFGIADFLAEVEPNTPVLLALEILPDTPCDTPYVLWVRHVRTYTPTPVGETDWILLILLIFSALAVCFAALLLYRALSRRRPTGVRASARRKD